MRKNEFFFFPSGYSLTGRFGIEKWQNYFFSGLFLAFWKTLLGRDLRCHSESFFFFKKSFDILVLISFFLIFVSMPWWILMLNVEVFTKAKTVCPVVCVPHCHPKLQNLLTNTIYHIDGTYKTRKHSNLKYFKDQKQAFYFS